MSKLPLRFEYWKSLKNRQWYWRIKAGNNEPICQSEGYKTKASVVKVFHTLFDFQTMPVLIDINTEAFAKFTHDVLYPKKRRPSEGKLNRNWP